jgi:hypothetical protein
VFSAQTTLIFFAVLGMPLLAFVIGCVLSGKAYLYQIGPYVGFHYAVMGIALGEVLLGRSELVFAGVLTLVLLWIVGPFFALLFLISFHSGHSRRRGFEVILKKGFPSQHEEREQFREGR